MAQVRQKKKQVRAKKPSIAKAYKQESMRQYKSAMSDVKRVLGKTPTKLKRLDWKEAKRLTPAESIARRKARRKAAAKTLAKKVPGVGAAALAHDVMRAGAKKGCIRRGGKWVGGKCQIAKKTRTKASGPDPRFARTRGKK